MSHHSNQRAIDLSVIIVNYNVKHYLHQCLQSVFRALERVEGEVIVVDNASSDGSQAMLRETFGDRITLIENQDNPGFAKANNQALRQAQGRYVLLLNPDTLVEERSFVACRDYLDAHPEAGGLGVYMHDGEGNYLPESKRALPTPWVSFYKIFGLSSLFPQSRRFGQYHLTYLDKEKTHRIDILSGAYMWMRKSVLDEVGLLDETYFMYGEDIDLSYRIQLAGYENVYFAGTKILHYKGESTKKGSLNYVRVFYQAMIIFADKYFGGGQKRGFIAAIRLAVYLRAFLAIVHRLVKRLGFPLLEGGLIYGIMYGIQAYWQHYVKYIEGGEYPDEFRYVYLPAYALLFVLYLAIGGAYRRPFRLRPLAMAPFWGFLTIATVTYMFPFIQNFSRAIVGLSAVFTMLLSLGLRGLLNWRENGQFFFTERNKRRVLLAGSAAEVAAADQLIRQQLDYPAELIGAALRGSATQPGIARLGGWSDLAALVRLYDVQEIIFSNRTTPTAEVLAAMRDLRHAGVEMKILPHGQEVLIGPQAVITAQVGRSMQYAIQAPRMRARKRWFDRLASAALLLLLPLNFWAYRRRAGIAWRLWQVLSGRCTLVGYANHDPDALPRLAPGLLDLRDRTRDISLEGIDLKALDEFYARHYRWELDLEILLRNWQKA